MTLLECGLLVQIMIRKLEMYYNVVLGFGAISGELEYYLGCLKNCVNRLKCS